jgi:hypothetical protein
MSHKTSITTKVSNLSSLKKALDRLNIKYREGNHKTKGNYNVHEDVDLIIDSYGESNLNSAVGLKKQADGTYQFTGDFYEMYDDKGRALNSEVFKNRVENAYNFEEINEKLTPMGFICDDTNLDFSQKKINYVMQRTI